MNAVGRAGMTESAAILPGRSDPRRDRQKTPWGQHLRRPAGGRSGAGPSDSPPRLASVGTGPCRVRQRRVYARGTIVIFFPSFQDAKAPCGAQSQVRNSTRAVFGETLPLGLRLYL